ncbi:MAG TPA: hypothetical protein VJX23_06450 [Candidatus Binataceae bacterium]|nr:hypothetical protein [Candidatus Binataceae bacterium]
MRSLTIWKLAAIGLALNFCACGAIEASRQAEEAKKQEFVKRVDTAHVWVTTGDPPAGKPFTVLGPLSYSEPFTPDAIDAAMMESRLKQMALEKYPDVVDAVVKEDSQVSADGSTVTVTAEAIKYDSSVDRDALHHMTEGLVVSPNGN